MMKKMSLALALSGALLATPLAWSQTLSATTQNPIYQLDDKVVLGRVESVYYSEIPELSDVPLSVRLIPVQIPPQCTQKTSTLAVVILNTRALKMTS